MTKPSPVKPGTLVYTSGLGGTFPRGITIGSIVEEIKTSEVWTRTYLIRPAVSPSRVTTVLVLIPQRVTQGIGNVWGATVNGDSASKRIAAAGDSIARMTAVLEARARLAILDSVRRATIDSVKRSLGIAPTLMTAADSAAARNQQAAAAAAAAARDTSRARRPVPTAVPAVPAVPRRDSVRPDSTRPPRPPNQ